MKIRVHFTHISIHFCLPNAEKTLSKFSKFLIFLKIISTSVTLGSGGLGGIFAPSLFIGAMLGAAYGTLVHAINPGFTASPETYALVGMGAGAGAVM